MTSREHIRNIIAGNPTDQRPGFWMGNPHDDSWPALEAAFSDGGDDARFQVRSRLGDDLCWITPEWKAYRHPEGKGLFPVFSPTGSRLLAGAESPADVENYPWPDPDLLDFTSTLEELRAAGDVYRAGGFWSHFFHLLSDLFGMEEYFIKMYTHPDLIHATTARVVDFYLEANRRFFEAAGDLVDGFFFGNDFGTQIDLLIGPDLFREFVFPYFRRLSDLGHAYGHQVILHSCGSIYKVIPDLIDLGVDALHPLQAKAANMDAERIGREFRGKVAFIGAIDTQDLLVNGSPEEVKAEVKRVSMALGSRYVVSPSHEALLPNVPPENVLAMSEAVRE